MGFRRVAFPLLAALALAACTPGAQSVPPANSAAPSAVIVGVSLLKYGLMSSQFGSVGGFNPALVVVAHGSTVQFHNEDGFDHTGSRINTPAFPSGNPLPISALNPSGMDVSQLSWSSGALTGGSYSKPFTATSVGTFLFGCQIHYPLMRGAIIVQ